jgi:hypothetical protein
MGVERILAAEVVSKAQHSLASACAKLEGHSAFQPHEADQIFCIVLQNDAEKWRTCLANLDTRTTGNHWQDSVLPKDDVSL